jgi:hypothetical protein
LENSVKLLLLLLAESIQMTFLAKLALADGRQEQAERGFLEMYL